jgi:hypothetical protein
MNNYLAVIIAFVVLVMISASGVSAAALVRDIAESAYNELFDADLSVSIGSTAVEVEGAEVGPAELSSEMSEPDSNAVNGSLDH